MSRIDEMNTRTGLEIAVIGMSGRFPGAKNLEIYWDNIKNGVESISFFTDEELIEEGIDPQLVQNPDYVKAKGYLEDIEDFDPAFFGYSPKEAQMMDPQFRLLHECTWEALEDAGYNPTSYKGLIGLYAGAAFNASWLGRVYSNANIAQMGSLETAILNLRDYLTTQISYKLNLKGPSFTLQTACSTSLVAIHLACQGLLSGECSIALAGGVSINLPQKTGYLYQDGMINSPDGYCRPFDARAKGTVFSDGVGMVALKTLEDALADGDHIYAVIKGTAINNDGADKVGYTAPSVKGQITAIRAALRVAEIEPESISYIETHGTGTTLGDPIEIEALKKAFNTDRKSYCPIGSVKGNIGHLNVASGVAGFIKTVLALQHRQIPPSLHYENPNPKIDFEDTPFYVNTQLTEWKNEDAPLRAGVSSFGLGGTNAHVILEEAPLQSKRSDSKEDKLILLSARTPNSLERVTANLAAYLHSSEVNLDDVAYTLQVGRKAFPYRRMAVSSDLRQACELLSSPQTTITGLAQQENPPVLFMFSGQGSQYVNMGLGLYREEPVFRREVDACLEMIHGQVDFDLKEILYPTQETSGMEKRINQTEVVQPLIFIFEYALAKLLMEWGIKPQGVIGHSIGEYVAACLSGVMSLKDALMLVIWRGRIMQKLPAGSMLSVPLSEEEIRPLLHDRLSLAAMNGPALSVVAGEDETIQAFADQLQQKGIECRKLHTSHAFHSWMVEPVLQEYREKVSRVKLNQPGIPYISNVLGGWAKEEVTNPDYWVNHLRMPVRFSEGLGELVQGVEGILVEVGPGNVLTTLARLHPAQQNTLLITNLVRHPHEEISDRAYLLNRIGQLWIAGVEPNWAVFNANRPVQRIPLPTYPFERRRYWLEPIKGSGFLKETAALIEESEEPQENIAQLYARPALSSQYEAPANHIEECLVKIWQQLFGIEQVGVRDDFYELGGHSLKATALTSQIHKELNVEVSLKDIFKRPTIKQLAEYIAQAEKHAYTSIKPVEEREYYPLSASQRRNFIFHHLAESGTTYNMPTVMILEGEVDYPRFEAAVAKLIARHETLRTSFEMVDLEPVQKIHKDVDFSIQYLKGTEDRIIDLAKEFVQPFDLSKAPLLRVSLVELAKEKHALFFDMHNIISDGVSLNVFRREFAELYEGVELPELKVQYKDFAQWQNDLFKTDLFKKQEEFWLKTFSDRIPTFNMPLDFPRGQTQTFEGKVIKSTLSKEVSDQLVQLSKDRNVTLNVILFSIFTILLKKYCGQDDIVVGSLVAGRRHADLENLIGMFTNFLPIRNTKPLDCSFLEFLEDANKTIVDVYENQDYPYDRLVEQFTSQLKRARNPFFDAMLIYHNEFDPNLKSDLRGLKFRNHEFEKGISKIDFKIDMVYIAEGFRYGLQFNTDLFTEETMRGLIAHFNSLIEKIAQNPEQKIADIVIFTPEEELILAQKRKLNRPALDEQLRVVLAATFTADPIRDYIQAWSHQFHREVEVQIAPYNQVFQELLNSTSLTCTNEGVNLLMVRFEDWIRDDHSDERSQQEKITQYYHQLVGIMANLQKTVPYFVCIFPVSTHLGFTDSMLEFMRDLTVQWKQTLADKENVYVIDFTHTADLYSVDQIFDDETDQAGHLPFSEEFYAVMGTVVTRNLFALQRQNFKVIALDCDNTLWSGICGEDGPEGVRVEEPYQALQNFVLQKMHEGMLLVLCSKNNENDVWDTFAQNPQMILQKEHFVNWRMNWNSKSANLRELAEKLNLGLDSFIFMDDSEVECAEVMSHCPEVLTLQLPKDPNQIPVFLHHVWAFDRLKVTEADRKRTGQYLLEKQRLQYQKEALSLTDFLQGLQLRTSLRTLEPGDLARAAQLTQRTNQFSLSTIRRSEQEIASILALPNTDGWVIEVADRFGDYGVVGLIIGSQKDDQWIMDTFLLSCRVLGREVEKAILIGLKQHYAAKGVQSISADFYPTQKNAAFREFLEYSDWRREQETADYIRYRLDLRDVPDTANHVTLLLNSRLMKEELSTDPVAKPVSNDMNLHMSNGSENSFGLQVENREGLLHKPYFLPLEMHTGKALLQLPKYQLERNRLQGNPYAAPRNELERIMADVWQQILGIEKIGVYDHFLQLGGDSIKAVQIASKLKKLHLELDSQLLFHYSTIAEICNMVVALTQSEDQGTIDGAIELTPIQKWFFELGLNAENHFNQSVMLYREEGFNSKILQKVLDRIVEHHDILRLVCEKVDGEGRLRIKGTEAGQIQLQTYDLTMVEEYQEQIRKEANQLQQSINLVTGPLVKAGLFKTPGGDYLLLIVHHLAADVVSWRILAEDLTIGYKQAAKGEMISFLPKTLSFQEWAGKLKDYAVSKELLQEIPYWSKIESVQNQPLPKDCKVAEDHWADRTTLAITLSAAETDQLLRNVNQVSHVEMNDLLLAALGTTIHEWTGQGQILIELKGHGRQGLKDYVDLTRTVGWFTTLYPVLLHPGKTDDLAAVLQDTAERLRQIPNNGMGYGILRYLTPDHCKEGVQFTARPEISFNYLGRVGQEMQPDLFTLADLSSGETSSPTNQRLYVLDLGASIREGLLRINIEYNQKMYYKETMEQLLEHYKANLFKMIQSCGK